MRVLPIAAAALMFGAPAFAQTKRIEAFGQIGWMRWAGDEGGVGSAAAYGGAVMLPLTKRWAVDVDVLTSRQTIVDGDYEAKRRRTLFTPGLVARWGTDRVYGFAGGGVGGQWDSTDFTRGPIVGIPQAGHVSNSRFVYLHGKGGLVATVTGRLLFRADLGIGFPYAMPNATVRAGVGWRF
ncbi:MAG: hypothetical protein IT168_21810 [Bryobacterales bacterium]|nr:hypothetical protein [Bryobacterales bacterium]